MRNRLLISILIIVGLLSVWRLSFKKPAAPPRNFAITLTPQTKSVNSSPIVASPPSSSPPLPAMVSLQDRQTAFMAAFKTPIVFYGRVLDQYNNPVTDAAVTCYANDHLLKSGSKYQFRTDGEGLFSVNNAKGLSLAIQVAKKGYLVLPRSDREVTSSGIFQYAVGTNRHVPDRIKPVIFRLQKLGVTEPLKKIGEKNFLMARDGTPLSIAVDEQGTHQVVLRCWNKEGYRLAGQRQYDWKLEVSVPNGGLFLREDAFAFEAPQDGYAPSDSIDMPSSLPYARWDSSAERSYFIRFSDGTFARANLEMHAAGDHFVVWESFFNPKVGSRNLESSAESQSASR